MDLQFHRQCSVFPTCKRHRRPQSELFPNYASPRIEMALSASRATRRDVDESNTPVGLVYAELAQNLLNFPTGIGKLEEIEIWIKN